MKYCLIVFVLIALTGCTFPIRRGARLHSATAQPSAAAQAAVIITPTGTLAAVATVAAVAIAAAPATPSHTPVPTRVRKVKHDKSGSDATPIGVCPGCP